MAQTNYMYNRDGKDPLTAAMLSMIPGLGQFYNGESRKGFLFLDVAILNYILLSVILLAPGISKAVQQFGEHFGMKVNHGVLEALRLMQFGSPVSLVVTGMVLAFIAYAVRDAYDHAVFRRRRSLYKDAVIELPEATSGSYIIHASLILSLAMLALFFFIPKPPSKQMIEFQFMDAIQSMPKPVDKANYRSRESVRQESKHFYKLKQIQKMPPKAELTKQTTEQQNQVRSQNSQATRETEAQRASASSSSQSASHQPKPIDLPKAPQPPRPTLLAQAIQPPAPVAVPFKSALPPTPLPPTLQKSMPSAATSINPLPKSISSGAAALTPVPMPTTAANSIMVPFPTQLPAGSLPHSGKANGALPMPSSFASGALQNAVQLPGVGSVPVFSGSKSNFAPHVGPGGTGVRTAFDTGAIGPAPMTRPDGGHSSTAGTVPVDMGSSRKPGNGNKAGQDCQGDGIPTPVKAGRRGTSFSDGPIRIVPSEAQVSGPGPLVPNIDGTSGKTNKPAAVIDPDFTAYMADLQRRIKRSWFPPKHTEKNRVKVMFKIHEDGTMSNLRISAPAGIAIADQAALQAVQSAAPFKHLPNGSPENVDVEFTFDYNIFKAY